MKKIRLLFLVITIICFGRAQTQVLFNGADATTTNGAIFYINNDSLLVDNGSQFIQNGFTRIDKDLINNNGTLQNDGLIDVNGNILNNDQLEGITTSSEFQLYGNWINNNAFSAGLSTVTLDGTIQEITGSQITTFYNLHCLGGLTDVKQLVGVDANVQENLDLGNVEFATGINTLSINNTATTAIIRLEGFVSSLGLGRLNRETNNTQAYLFPVGSTIGTARYRPIEITPETNNQKTYGVRLVNEDATLEGFDVLNFQDDLCLVNPNFFHRIYGDEQGDIKMFFDPVQDGSWSDMVHWQNIPQWQDMGTEINSSVSGFNTLLIEDWSDFAIPAFALAIKKPYLEVGPDIQTLQGISTDLTPVYIGPTITSVSWEPNDLVDCDDCFNTSSILQNTAELILTLNENEACSISDSITIFITPNQVFIPTGFSPNNDGINDVLKPLNDNIELWLFQVWNRWGELIFESENPTIGWDGMYKGKEQEIGVYTYFTEYQLEGQTSVNTQKGNITLIR